MNFLIVTCLCVVFQLALCYKPYSDEPVRHHHSTTVFASKSLSEERSHIRHHLEEAVGQRDVNQMAEDELRFLYFKIHDSDDNNKLDGCELVKSLFHWHEEEYDTSGSSLHVPVRIFSHEELAMMIDPILSADDKNLDGFVDYPEFVDSQKMNGF